MTPSQLDELPGFSPHSLVFETPSLSVPSPLSDSLISPFSRSGEEKWEEDLDKSDLVGGDNGSVTDWLALAGGLISEEEEEEEEEEEPPASSLAHARVHRLEIVNPTYEESWVHQSARVAIESPSGNSPLALPHGLRSSPEMRASQPAISSFMRASQPAISSFMRASQPAISSFMRASQPAIAPEMNSSQPAISPEIRASQPATSSLMRTGQPEMGASQPAVRMAARPAREIVVTLQGKTIPASPRRRHRPEAEVLSQHMATSRVSAQMAPFRSDTAALAPVNRHGDEAADWLDRFWGMALVGLLLVVASWLLGQLVALFV
jgi:hypothetical protein